MSMKNDEILRIETRLTTHTEEDIFILHLQGELDQDKMSPKLKERFVRLQQCRDYIKDHAARNKVIPMLMNDFKISESQAYRDYTTCIKVFNAASETTGQDFWVDILLGKTMETHRKAVAAGDFRSAAACLKTFKDTIKDFFGNDEAKNYRNLQPPVLITKYIPNKNLPENWKDLAAKIIRDKESKRTRIDITDAQIIEEENEDQHEE